MHFEHGIDNVMPPLSAANHCTVFTSHDLHILYCGRSILLQLDAGVNLGFYSLQSHPYPEL